MYSEKSMKLTHFSGLYAITDSQMNTATFVHDVEKAIIGGARIIQYRDKSQDKSKRLAQAQALQQLCQKYQVIFIINDDVELAQQIDADGVHLGKDDATLITARQQLGQNKIIGISCYNQLDNAVQAVKNGVDYVAFGRFFPSSTKPNAIKADSALLQTAKKSLHCPIVAIGGITPQNGQALITAGADCLAVINGLFGQDDIELAAKHYANLW